VIHLARYYIEQIYDKLIFFGPVIVVIILSAFLVYSTFVANIVVTAAVIAEEGTGSEAASAGVVNALTFIIPAVIGGFGIALLFKYRKKLTLKFFFGGALFFAGSFIIFFFADSILYIVQTQFYSIFILDFSSFSYTIFDIPPIIQLDIIYPVMILSCGIFGFWITYIITSKKFEKPLKNRAILIQSALMGAFLSVILPTFTVVILLIGLSLYDIYSVRRGPIKDIVTYTMEDEMRSYKNNNSSNDNNFNNANNSKNQDFVVNDKNVDDLKDHNEQYENKQKYNKPKFRKRFKFTRQEQNSDELDSMLTSMTYSSKDWDIGIGDLVFYSMLASQPLTPYFIYTHGMGLFDSFGLWIFWLISICTIIGILIGFIITIKLLERNSMLPGLPCSIALGLTGFGCSYFIIQFII